MTTDKHSGPLFPGADKRKFAYQDERVHGGAYLEAYPPHRDNTDGHNVPFNDPRYTRFEFVIHNHTGNSLTVEVRAYLNGTETIKQRKQRGYATEYEIYQTIISFGELMNRIFSPGCQVFYEDEAWPDVVKDVMKGAYK